MVRVPRLGRRAAVRGAVHRDHVLTDVVQYWVHRLFHRSPALWRFHAVHHSAQHMDWIAGARMHFLEILILRGTTVIPTIMLSVDQRWVPTVFVVYLYATFVHSNLGLRFRPVEKLLVTPRFHHWHHGIEKEAIDVNFAIHFPLLDRLFGTYHMPEDGRWPEGYGMQGHPAEGLLAAVPASFQTMSRGSCRVVYSSR